MARIAICDWSSDKNQQKNNPTQIKKAIAQPPPIPYTGNREPPVGMKGIQCNGF